MRKLMAVALVIFLACALGALLCIPVNAQERVTDPEWTVTDKLTTQAASALEYIEANPKK
jgi:hypothetical protein